MEKITCDVIGDLLPLYCDDVCSQDSRELVREHLEDCRECCNLLQKMRQECVLAGEEEQARETIVRDMAVSWKKGLRRSFLKGALIMLCLCVIMAGGWLALTRLVMVQVPAGSVEIALGSVTEESVEIFLKTNDEKKVAGSTYRMTEDGKYYIILERGILAEGNGGGENWESIFRISRNGKLESGESVPITEIYYGTGRDSVLIWKAGSAQD